MTGKDTAMLCPGSFGGVLGMSMRCLLHRISNADMKPSRQSRLCRIQWSTVKHYLAVLSKMTTTLTTRLLSICVIRLVPGGRMMKRKCRTQSYNTAFGSDCCILEPMSAALFFPTQVSTQEGHTLRASYPIRYQKCCSLLTVPR